MGLRRRILLADANDTDLECFKEYLSALDCEILSVTDGAEVLECVQNFKPNLIVLDSMISTINGFELCQQIKNDPATSGTMILEQIAKFRSRPCELQKSIFPLFYNNASTTDFLKLL
jgi:CheY-like chemotaxis protein